jgi:phage gp36-like protein
MAYATVADLVARYGEEEIKQRTDRLGAGAIDAAVAQQALDDAAAEIDSYLASRYTLPLPTAPAILSRLNCTIARYRLWEDLASDRVRQDYDDAMRFLTALARGTVSLGLPDTLPPQDKPGLSLSAAQSGPAPVFGRDATSGF